MYSNSLELDLDTVLESLDDILMSDDEKYASMEAYLDELVSHDSYDEVNTLFESVYEYDTVMEENNGSNNKGIIEKIKKAIAWLKKKFFDIVNAIKNAFRKIFDFFKNLFKRKYKSKKQKIAELEEEIKKLENSNEALKQKSSALKEELKKKSRDLRSETSRNNHYEKMLNNERKKSSDLQSTLIDVGYERNILKKDNNDLKSKLQEKDNKLKQYRKDNEEQSRKLRDTEEENKKLKTKLEDSEYYGKINTDELYDAKYEIERLRRHINFLAGKDFDKVLYEKFERNLTEKEKSALYYALFSSHSFFEELINASELAEVIGSKDNWERLYNRKIGKLTDLINDNSVSNRVNWNNLLSQADKLFDSNRISVIKKTSESMEKNFNNAINLLKHNISDAEREISTMSGNNLRMVQTHIKDLNGILTKTSEISSKSLSYLALCISSVNKMQEIYTSLLEKPQIADKAA